MPSWAGLDEVRAWDAVIAAEPTLAVDLSADQIDEALTAIANFVDLKSPYTLAHSVAVGALAGAAAARLGLSADEAPLLRRAGLFPGFGRVGGPHLILG